MQLQFVGCGDAFGSGGRFNTCFHVTAGPTNFLIDCGATAVVGLKRYGIDADAIDFILITHFHGDHFGGLPFLLLEAQVVTKRSRPLTLAGPPGIRERYVQAMATAFPSSPQFPAAFKLDFVELQAGTPTIVHDIEITPQAVVHTEAAGPCFGYRMQIGETILAYSGDTQWTDSIVDIGKDADLFICECYAYEKKIKFHTDFKTLEAHLPRINPKRLVLTHMSEDMLKNRHLVEHETAEDGKIVSF
jgi:ribonuclease BN (tRNA processing enzyme)